MTGEYSHLNWMGTENLVLFEPIALYAKEEQYGFYCQWGFLQCGDSWVVIPHPFRPLCTVSSLDVTIAFTVDRCMGYSFVM